MRKLKKLSLDKLAKTMPTIREIEQRNYVGGTGPSGFEILLFANYFLGNGSTMNLSTERFNDIATVAASGTVSSESTIIISGVSYTKKVISFYSNDDYDYALGRATVYYNSNGVAVGFKDEYDFNALPPGERDSLAKWATWLGSGLGEEYSIRYGVFD